MTLVSELAARVKMGSPRIKLRDISQSFENRQRFPVSLPSPIANARRLEFSTPGPARFSMKHGTNGAVNLFPHPVRRSANKTKILDVRGERS